MDDSSSTKPSVEGEALKKKVKPVLKKHGVASRRPKKEIKWNEEVIEEHDQLRGTRMKIDEPNTPYTHYDSHSDGNESDSSGKRPKSPAEHHGEKILSWDELHVKLAHVADNYPSSPSASDGEEVKRKQEFVEHRKHHYNEMEMVRKFKEEHASEENDADDDMDM